MDSNFGKSASKRDRSRSLVGGMWMMIVAVLIIFGISFLASAVYISERTRNEYASQEADIVIQGIQDGITGSLDNYKDISRLIMLNKEVMRFLRSDSDDKGLINDTRYGVMDVLNVCRDMDSVFIFRKDDVYVSTGRGEYVVDYDTMKSYPWQFKIINSRGRAIVTVNARGMVHRKNNRPIITIERAIYDINTQRFSGVLIMNMSVEMLERLVEKSQGDEVCILDTDGTVLAGSKKLSKYFEMIDLASESYANIELNDEDGYRMITAAKCQGTPFVIICAVDDSGLSIPLEKVFGSMMMLFAFVLSLVLAGVYTARHVTSPILALTEAMEKTRESGWMERIDVKMPKNEIGQLADSYNSMIDYLNALFKNLIEKEESVRKAEMRVLQEQIKPHFLYNSLATISNMALESNAVEVHSALETLGSFYRNFLSKGDREIPLQRELKIIKDYIALQKLRYGDIIDSEFDIDDATLTQKIPKLILQPLVENSINHGIRMKGEPGIIRITSKIKEDGIHICVWDDGIGMSAEQIENILSDNPEAPETESLEYPGQKSFGLKGTLNRIRYYCNDWNAVAIRSEVGEFTEIELIIPTKKNGDV